MGLTSARWWYGIAACLVVAAVLAALWPARDSAWSWTLRVVGVLVVGTVGLRPAFLPIPVEEPNDVRFPAFVASIWEPPLRDRLTKTREEAERQPSPNPCLWFKVADFETKLGMIGEAMRDERRSTVPRAKCP